jgi:fucose permease
VNKYQLICKEYSYPFVFVRFLFTLWRFANVIADPMVQAFKKALGLSNTEPTWVETAFYGGLLFNHGSPYERFFFLKSKQ